MRWQDHLRKQEMTLSRTSLHLENRQNRLPGHKKQIMSEQVKVPGHFNPSNGKSLVFRRIELGK